MNLGVHPSVWGGEISTVFSVFDKTNYFFLSNALKCNKPENLVCYSILAVLGKNMFSPGFSPFPQ